MVTSNCSDVAVVDHRAASGTAIKVLFSGSLPQDFAFPFHEEEGGHGQGESGSGARGMARETALAACRVTALNSRSLRCARVRGPFIGREVREGFEDNAP